MRTLIATGALVAVLCSPASAELRDVAAFDSVAARDPVRVEIASGPAHSVNVSGADAARIATRVEGETLRIYQTNRPWFGSNHLDALVRITTPDISAIAAARGASVVASDIEADDMSLSAAMGAAIRISGSCNTLDASAAMGASINANSFACGSADVSAAMGGEARVNASQSADASASMGGAVNVAGGASRGSTSSSMGGSISFTD